MVSGLRPLLANILNSRFRLYLGLRAKEEPDAGCRCRVHKELDFGSLNELFGRTGKMGQNVVRVGKSALGPISWVIFSKNQAKSVAGFRGCGEIRDPDLGFLYYH